MKLPYSSKSLEEIRGRRASWCSGLMFRFFQSSTPFKKEWTLFRITKLLFFFWIPNWKALGGATTTPSQDTFESMIPEEPVRTHLWAIFLLDPVSDVFFFSDWLGEAPRNSHLFDLFGEAPRCKTKEKHMHVWKLEDLGHLRARENMLEKYSTIITYSPRKLTNRPWK